MLGFKAVQRTFGGRKDIFKKEAGLPTMRAILLYYNYKITPDLFT